MSWLLQLFGRGPWTNQRTYYQDHVKEPLVQRPGLPNGEIRTADVCVVGAGIAGLTVALGLSEAGKSVIVVEAAGIGEAASGLNAGMAINGYSREGSDLVDDVGLELAKDMFAWSVAAQSKLQSRIKQYGIQCDMVHAGHVTLSITGDTLHECEEEVALINSELGANWESRGHGRVRLLQRDIGHPTQLWPAARVRKHYNSNMYHHGIFDPHTFSVNPLGLVLGLARACEANGARIYERTRATGLRKDGAEGMWHVSTESGASVHGDGDGDGHGGARGLVKAREVVLATNANMKGLSPALDRSLFEFWTYILVTEPLGEERMKRTMGGMECVCDDRILLAYYRPLSDTRILWGGLASVFPLSREKAEAKLRAEMIDAYPDLKDVKTSYIWGGSLGWSVSEMPLVGRTPEGIWYTTGYGGHGLVPTSVGADLIVSAILSDGRDQRYELYNKTFPPRYAGWPFIHLGVAATLFYYNAKDKYRIWRSPAS